MSTAGSSAARNRRSHVKIPMMPKGVEHTRTGMREGDVVDVKIPMMPKGVEHHLTLTTREPARSREDYNDAERR